MEYAIGLTVVILMTAVGLGFVIFVHELGHFLVAKLCGVKCDKFYLGFDIGGWKICKFRWGETEYGIGILPLGGYVKMLGQEDNPSKMREEMERAKKGMRDEGRGMEHEAPAAAAATLGGEAYGTEAQDSENPDAARRPLGDGAQPPDFVYDPRSYLAQSVPKRMAIISAGVIMNVIFAFLLAFAAYLIGVEEIPCTIGVVYPGEAGWQADLRPGDEILEIGGKKMHQFKDLQAAIQLGAAAAGDSVPIKVKRPGTEKPFLIHVMPDRRDGAPVLFIGVGNGFTTKLAADRKTWIIQKQHPVLPGSAADRAEPPLKNGDRIVQIDDVPIDNYAQISTELARKVDEPIQLTIERDELDAEGNPTGRAERLTSVVPPNPMRHLGVVMKMGEITAVQNDSPAKRAGIAPGAKIEDPSGDPMRLPDWLRSRAGETVELTVQHKDAESPKKVLVLLRRPINHAPPLFLSGPVASSSLGVSYQILNRIDRVIEGSPADKAGLRSGDLITGAVLLPPDKEVLEKYQFDQSEETLEFSEKRRNWAALMSVLQRTFPGTKVLLTFDRQEEKGKTAELLPVEADDWFDPDRGFRFEPYTVDRKAETFAEAASLGGEYTLFSLTTVFRTLKALGTGKVSPRALSGPITIVQVILKKADEGFSSLLLFLTFLSANLAVINFLPIPVLDGGHFVLLAYEGIRGKPANENVQTVLAYIGLALILALMVWVFGLDFELISRHG